MTKASKQKPYLATAYPCGAPTPKAARASEAGPEFRVTGTRNRPVNYVNAAGMGLDSKYRYRTEHIREGLGGKTIERIPKEHIDRMLELGILPPQEK